LKTDILILIANLEDKSTYEWTLDKFENRVFMIRDILEEYFETDELTKISKVQDPFWDPPNVERNKTDRLKGASFKKKTDEKKVAGDEEPSDDEDSMVILADKDLGQNDY
jgi:hypothetical protein